MCCFSLSPSLPLVCVCVALLLCACVWVGARARVCVFTCTLRFPLHTIGHDLLHHLMTAGAIVDVCLQEVWPWSAGAAFFLVHKPPHALSALLDTIAPM